MRCLCMGVSALELHSCQAEQLACTAAGCKAYLVSHSMKNNSSTREPTALVCTAVQHTGAKQ